ncbi:MAG: hypothetical protein AB7H93_16110 [Vicinamibacterales bacterium]
MRVFLIPIGGEEYEPYFEPPDEDDEEAPAETGWFGRLRHRLRQMLREAEAERHRRHESGVRPPSGMMARAQRKAMRWIVERAAEQRLLWHLRTADEVTLEAPDDLSGERALEVMKRGLRRDADRHLRWFVVHGLGLVVSLALVLIPGPNVVGYFLTFTTVGHLLAWRGAQHGHRRVRWTVAPSALLSELRAVLPLDPTARAHRVHDLAHRLGLQHLATFFERLALPPA